MEIKKVKWDGWKLTIQWDESQGEGATTIDHTLVSTDRPSPEFVAAMDAVVAPVMKLLELEDEYGDTTGFRGLTASIDDQGRRGMTFCVLKSIEGANAPVVLNTPYLPEPEAEDPNPCLPQDLQKVGDRVVAWAEKFVAGGAREQGELFEAA